MITDPLLGLSLSVPNLAPGAVSVQFLDSTIAGDPAIPRSRTARRSRTNPTSPTTTPPKSTR